MIEDLDALEDYEAKLDGTRRWQKEWHFRVGVHHLQGLIEPEEAGRQYADLAYAVVDGMLPVVSAQVAVKHGPPPGRGAVVVGMGSLGAGLLTARSDLDLIVGLLQHDAGVDGAFSVFVFESEGEVGELLLGPEE